MSFLLRVTLPLHFFFSFLLQQQMPPFPIFSLHHRTTAAPPALYFSPFSNKNATTLFLNQCITSPLFSRAITVAQSLSPPRLNHQLTSDCHHSCTSHEPAQHTTSAPNGGGTLKVTWAVTRVTKKIFVLILATI